MFSLIIAILAIALIVAVVALSGYFGGDAISDAQAKVQAAQLINEQVQIFSAMDGFQADNRRWPSDIQELVTSGYLRSNPAGVQVQTTAAASFDLVSSAHAADPLALGWSMPAARVPIIFTVKVPKTTCQAYNQVSRGDNGILRQAFESLAAQCYGADGNYNVVAKKAVAGVNLAGTLPTSVEPGNLPVRELDDWWDAVPDGAVQVPTAPDKTPKAELALTGAGLNFGQVQLGQAVTSQTITLRNGGKVLAQSVSIATPAGFDLVDNTCGAQLGAGASCSFAIGFAPAAVESYAGAVTASASDGSSVQLPTSGSGVLGSATFTEVSFGDVPAGQQVQGDAVLTNTGVGALRLGGATVTGEGFSIAQSDCGATLAAGSSCSIKVALTATGVTSHIGVLTVPSAEMGNLHADLAGQSRQARLDVSPATVAFPDTQVNQTSTSAAHTLTNTGNLPTSVELLPTEPYGISGSTCTGALLGGASCSFHVTFTPVAAQAYNTKAVDIAGAVGGTAQVTATGQGVLQSGSTSDVDFGMVAVGSTKDMPVVLTNTGKGPLQIKNKAVDAQGGLFSIQSDTCAASVAVGSSCTITIRYTASGSNATTSYVSWVTGGGAYKANLTASPAQTLTYSLGVGGKGGDGSLFGGGYGNSGGLTTATYMGVTLTAYGGKFGGWGANAAGGPGGSYSAPQGASGGSGGGGTWARRSSAGSGGGIANSDGSIAAAGAAGGDYFGLRALIGCSAGGAISTGGSGGSSECLGAGGAGGGSLGGNGGNGFLGGGGGGASTAVGGAPARAGSGGDGALVVKYKDGSFSILTSGTSFVPPKTVAAIWAIGGGGGGGGSITVINGNTSTSGPSETANAGSGGGAGGVAYASF